jgi:putative hydrolase of the HAD superfamily
MEYRKDAGSLRNPLNRMEDRQDSIRAVYFDLDDTLCAYWEASKQGLRTSFAHHAPEGLSPEALMQSWAEAFREFSPTLKQTGWYEGYCESGEPTRTEQMRLTLERLGVSNQEAAEKLSASYREERNNALRLFPEALEVLNTLKGQFPLGLITNGPADIQREEIATLGIAHFFDHIFIEGEMRQGKPHAAVFERAQRAVGFEPDEIVFVGNSYAHDIRPALENGWHAVWVRRDTDIPPSRNKLEERPEGSPEPDAVISDLRDLLRWIASHSDPERVAMTPSAR